MQIKKIIPSWFKPVIRFFWYKNERRKVFLELNIRHQQNRLIKIQYNPACRNLIVFIVDGADWFTGKDAISGGILSIASICEETEKLENLHGCKTMMVTHDQAFLILQHTQFPNKIKVFRLKQVFRYFKGFDKLIIHIPELLVTTLGKQFEKYAYQLANICDLQINILNQSICLMPGPEEIAKLKKFTLNITQTTAHENYTTVENRENYGIPLHKLSVFGSPEKYHRTSFEKKAKLIIVSPDEHPQKNTILQNIASSMPDYKMVVIRNMPYLTYLNHIARAKYAITFGEGMDFYFIETVFSGGVSIAVYNSDFFTNQFWKLPGVFDDYTHLEKSVSNFMISTNNAVDFAKVNKQQYDAVYRIYKYDEYLENITKFYRKDYTFK